MQLRLHSGKIFAILLAFVSLTSAGLFISRHWWMPAAAASHASALDRLVVWAMVDVGIAFVLAQLLLAGLVWKFHGHSTAKPLASAARIAIIVSVALALGMLFILVMPHRGMRTAESDAIEFALLLLLMLMMTPLAFGYFFSWLMLPFAVITQRVLAGKGLAILLWSLPALALLALALPFPRRAQLYGNIFFATLLLFIGLSIELLHCKAQRDQAQPPATRT